MAFPLTVGMVLFSWVDVITMAGLAVWMVSFRTHPRIATVALVLALAAKPTTLIALVPIFFWSVRARRQVIIAARHRRGVRAAVRGRSPASRSSTTTSSACSWRCCRASIR